MAIVLRTVLFMTMLIFLIHVSFGFKENEIFDFNSHLDIIRVTQYFVRYNIETKKNGRIVQNRKSGNYLPKVSVHFCCKCQRF